MITQFKKIGFIEFSNSDDDLNYQTLVNQLLNNDVILLKILLNLQKNNIDCNTLNNLINNLKIDLIIILEKNANIISNCIEVNIPIIMVDSYKNTNLISQISDSISIPICKNTSLINLTNSTNNYKERLTFYKKIESLSSSLFLSLDFNNIKSTLDSNLAFFEIYKCYIYLNDNNSNYNHLIYNFDLKCKINTNSFDINRIIESNNNTYNIFEFETNDLKKCFILFELSVNCIEYINSLGTLLSNIFKAYFNFDELNKAHTEILKHTKELEDTNKKLSNLDNLKNEFIANITHDFRSPLMIILNTTDIAMKYDNINSITKKRYSTILEASLKLKNTIDKLLDLVKMDSQGLKLNIECIRIKKFMENITDFYKSALLNTNIHVDSNFNIGDVNIYTDSSILEDILNNIISNAMKFTNSINGLILIELEELDNSIQIKISDNGIGIPEDKLSSIFNRFEQVENGINNIYKGTGIGLAFSKQLIQYLNGSIRAESNGRGKGSKFIIELNKSKAPISISHKNLVNYELPEEIDKKRFEFKNIINYELKNRIENKKIETYFTNLNSDDEFDIKKAIILIVDDNIQISTIVSEYLKNNGFINLIIAHDGLQGVNAAYMYRPDIIICDYNMPNMRGDELHDEISNNPDFKRIPFIFLSAVTDKNIIIERKKKGVIEFLTKPVDETNLIIAIKTHLTNYMELKSLVYKSMIDELTGINNKRNLKNLIKNQFTIRKLIDISVIFFDLDNFKTINDTYGHQTGDVILHETGKILRQSLRTYDIFGRFGGEEFLIILPETNDENAFIVAEKLRKKIENNLIISNNKEIKYTSSFGIASLFSNSNFICNILNIESLNSLYTINTAQTNNWKEIEENKIQIPNLLITLSDEALYKAKSTICNSCNFSSFKQSDFKLNLCPKCKSENITIGRNKSIIISKNKQ